MLGTLVRIIDCVFLYVLVVDALPLLQLAVVLKLSSFSFREGIRPWYFWRQNWSMCSIRDLSIRGRQRWLKRVKDLRLLTL